MTGRGHVAFGFRVCGAGTRSLLAADELDWPELWVRQRIRSAQRGPGDADERGAAVPLTGGDWLALDRATGTATYHVRERTDPDSLIHPRLAPAAGLMARWLGREVFHAGAFLSNGGAWALTGTNNAGKSTILAALAMAGEPVLTDDTLVVEDGRAYAGPRCVDLRQLDVLGARVAEHARTVRDGTRYRLDLPPIAAAAPLRGWFHLEWGDAVEAVPCPLTERFRRVVAERRYGMTAVDPHALLALAVLPAWVLRRPRGAEHMDRLLEHLAQLSGHLPVGARSQLTTA